MIRQIDIQENLTGSLESGSPGPLSSKERLRVSYDESGQSSFYRDFTIKPGLLLTMARRKEPGGSRVVHDIENAPISFGYNLRHSVRCTISHGGKGKETFRHPGSFVLSRLPKTRCVIETPPGENVLGVSLHFSVGTFKAIFQELPPYLEGLFSKSKTVPRFYHQSRINPETAFVLDQIVRCPYHGEIQRLFLESKALELAALMLCAMGEGRSDQFVLSRRESEQIREAYQILSDRMDAPPGLCELSREVGMNRNKLNRGFRQLYGSTVFGVLRDLRLRTAWGLLQNSEMSLVEIALAVGYANQSNFSTAFRHRYGLTPSNIRKGGAALGEAGEGIGARRAPHLFNT